MDASATVVICSYRLGGSDGVAIEAAKWAAAWRSLGATVRTVAGAGSADLIVDGLAADSSHAPTPDDLEAAFSGAALVVVENLCSLPLNPRAGRAVAAALAGRPAILHHHDLASQRRSLAHLGPPPDDSAWLHVCVNRRSTVELQAHGYRAVTMYNAFEPDPPEGARDATRAALGLGGDDRLVFQPTRAIERKGIAHGVALAEALGATYWLRGPAEDGYDRACERLLAGATTPVIFGPGPLASGTIADGYAASDLVALPSTWEGFGNPALESATHRRPLAIGPYPVAAELRRFGFQWFDAHEAGVIAKQMAGDLHAVLDTNQAIARRHFSTADLPARLARCAALIAGSAPRQRRGLAGGALAARAQVQSTIGGR